ncbi:hypothetical protein CJO88_05755 [Ralstonia solanacearum]|nr:hypothetical protein CJO88_05755 [Ralstonia solanacearum]
MLILKQRLAFLDLTCNLFGLRYRRKQEIAIALSIEAAHMQTEAVVSKLHWHDLSLRQPLATVRSNLPGQATSSTSIA